MFVLILPGKWCFLGKTPWATILLTVVKNLTSASGLYFFMLVITGFNQIFNKVCGKGKNHVRRRQFTFGAKCAIKQF